MIGLEVAGHPRVVGRVLHDDYTGTWQAVLVTCWCEDDCTDPEHDQCWGTPSWGAREGHVLKASSHYPEARMAWAVLRLWDDDAQADPAAGATEVEQACRKARWVDVEEGPSYELEEEIGFVVDETVREGWC